MAAISIFTILCTVVALILLYVLVLPKSKDGHLPNKFLQFLHNYFHFHKLYLEAIIRFFFVLSLCPEHALLAVGVGFNFNEGKLHRAKHLAKSCNQIQKLRVQELCSC